ncbi:L-arabinose isomerase [Endozoicomonas sp. OPT23]|uniref:L-arabinose isomerase n=1 Tax=Endozoicomonas sp. OPT23 TaxID=2072845 RepID=UPI00129AD2EF|nr:L-arabinose isomerase [Endozoicomonas sp. OPT23]MRI33311.1 L-arabinose isomerase [Endozoicomonas sp. OPT23]
MKVFEKQVWFVTGSQDLYGPKVLEAVAEHSEEMVQGFNGSAAISAPFVNKGTVKSAREIALVCREANNDDNCAGLILWMHTFSPAKMWIAGLKQLNKPFVHLHTQFNAGLPWNEINMNFMNTNQSAHGDREFGFIGTRMKQDRKVIVGHWQDSEVHKELDDWCRAAMGWMESQTLKVARFGDNMRQVAVTDGNKVAAQIQFGFEVNAYGLGDLAAYVDAVTDEQVAALIEIYKTEFTLAPELLEDAETLKIIQQEARLEAGMEAFLVEHDSMAYTNCFEDLTGLTALPGLATQRLMAKGYGYGGEGDWKTAAMTRITKVMAKGLNGGTSFMEDYTYNFAETDQVLGAHMLEVCPTIAADKPSVQVHLHTIGCRADVARLIFTGQEGDGINLSLVEMGSHYRLIANTVKAATPEEMPHLPVASTLWEPMPNLKTAAAAWIYAGGAHHTTYTQAISMDVVNDFAEMAGIELVTIDEDTKVNEFKKELRHNEMYYRFM